MAALELILVLFAVVAALRLLSDRVAVPHAALLVLGGVVLAVIPGLPRARLDPEVVFLIFIPPLLYWTALNTSWRDFRSNLRSISLLAIGLVLATMTAVAAVAHALAPELIWPAAFVLGAIVSPPDPVAVTAVTRKLRISRTIVTVLEGEGLLNDATALVAFRMAVVATVAGSFSAGEAALRFLWSASGGILVGLALGWAIRWVRRRIGKAPVVENTISILTPFATFIPAERLGVSGVLAVVAVGLYLGRYGPKVVAPQTRVDAESMWRMVTFLLEGLVFILIGLELPQVLSALETHTFRSLVLDAAAVSGTAILVRLLWVFPGAYLPGWVLRRLGKPEPYPPWRNVAFTGWAGLRGGDSLVIALSVPLTVSGGKPFPGRALILFLTFGVIFFTLVVQGFTLKGVIRLLGLQPDVKSDSEETQAWSRITAAGLNSLKEIPRSDALEEEVRKGLESKYRHISHRFDARARGQRHEKDEKRTETYRRLRLGMIGAERKELLRLRDEDVISDGVMRRIQKDLDLEQVLLESSDSAWAGLEKPDEGADV
jgi:CPA1 family monovalent cation:H+ antiporter